MSTSTKTQTEIIKPAGIVEDKDVYGYWRRRLKPLEYAVLLAIYDWQRVNKEKTVNQAFCYAQYYGRIMGFITK